MKHRRCDGNHPGREARPGDYTSEQCRLCWLSRQRGDSRPAPDTGGSAPRRLASPASSCRHLGEATAETVLCPTCSGHVELKLFACCVHGRCTTTTAAPDVACCATCPDYQPQAPAPEQAR
jgi:hypothetical protein